MFVGCLFQKENGKVSAAERVGLDGLRSILIPEPFHSHMPPFEELSQTNRGFLFNRFVATTDLPKEVGCWSLQWNQSRGRKTFIDDRNHIKVVMWQIFSQNEPPGVERTKFWMYNIVITKRDNPSFARSSLGVIWCQQGNYERFCKPQQTNTKWIDEPTADCELMPPLFNDFEVLHFD